MLFEAQKQAVLDHNAENADDLVVEADASILSFFASDAACTERSEEEIEL